MAQKRRIVVPPRDIKLTREILNEHFHSNIHFERTWMDEVADFLTQGFGTITFLGLNAVFFASWFIYNVGLSGAKPFDPYPFIFLTMIVSLEAILLSVVVLISQNRQSKIADIRQQMDFEIDVRSEEEITKILHLLDELRPGSGTRKHDPELEEMKQKIDLEKIQQEAEKNET